MLAVDKLLINYKKAIFDNKQLLKELKTNYEENIISLKKYNLEKINLNQANATFASSIKYLNQYKLFCKKEKRFKK